MKTTSTNRGILPSLTSLAVVLTLFSQSKFAAQAASVTFTAPANCAADTDVKAGGGGQLFAFTWGASATTVNGVSFSSLPTTSFSGAVAPNLSLSGGFTQANGTAFVAGVAPFNALSSSYSNLLRGADFDGVAPINSIGTVTLSNLTVGHTYFVELWASDPRTASSNRVENVSSGGGPVVQLTYNSTLTNGGVGQFTYATFTADAATQDITLDASASFSAPYVGALQLNAIQLRDISGVWSGTASANWNETDVNFSGSSFAAVKAAAAPSPVVYFSDTDLNNAAVANNNITIDSAGVTGADVVFNNNAITYTLGSAGSTGISGAYSLTVSGTNTVTFNNANTYSGSTTLGANARLTLNAANSYVGSTVLGAGAQLTLGAAGSIANTTLIDMSAASTLDGSATSLTLGASATLRGSGTIKGNVNASSGSSIVLGTGVGAAGTLTFNNNLTLNGQPLTFDLSLADSADKLNVGGALTLNGNSTITLNTLAPIQVNGTYTLLTFASKSGTGTFLPASGTLPNGATFTLNNNPTSVTLTVSGGLNGTVGTWITNASGSWTNPANWSGGTIARGTDNIADFSSLNITVSPVVSINTNVTIGSLLFGDTVQSHNWSLSTGTNTLAVSTGSPIIFVNPGQSTTISSVLLGSQGFTKLGSGSLTLSGANKFTGGVTVSGSSLSATSSGALNSTNNSTLVPVTLSNATLTLLSSASYTNNIVIAAGSSNTISWGSAQFLAGTAGGPFSGGGTVTNNCGGGTPRLNGGANHNFTGTMVINATSGGGLLSAFDEPATAVGFGTAGSSNAVYEFNGGSGTLNYMATSDWVGKGLPGATNFIGELRGDGSLYANNGRSGVTTLEIGGRNTDSTFSGSIRNAGASGGPTTTAINKVGSGKLTLSGVSTYTNVTTVRSGTLSVSGTLANTPVTVASGATFELTGTIGSSTVNVQSGARFVAGNAVGLGSAAITLNGVMDTTANPSFSLGSATLSGSGVVTGSVTVASALNPGTIGGVGTLTVTNGDFTATGATLTFDLSNTPGSGNDFLAVNGNLTLNSGVTVSINKLVGSLGAGTYVLAKCSGTLSGTLPTLVGADLSDSLNLNTSSGQLELVVSGTTTLTWTGNGTGNLWDIGTSYNWLNGTTKTNYADGNAVIFSNTGGTNPVVNIPANVAPSLITFTGGSNYTFAGAGLITDGASLIKGGSNTLTVLNTNDFVGTVFLNSGTLAVGNGTMNGQLAASIATSNGAALVFTTPLDQTSSNVLSGAGSFTKLGAGVLTMIGNSTLSGPSTISAGTLQVGNGIAASGALGTGAVTNNALLKLNRATSVTMNNVIVNNGAMDNAGGGPVTLSGSISGPGALTNDLSAGVLTLAGANTYSGATVISGGSVVLQNFAGFGSGSVSMDDFGGGVILMVPTPSTNVIPNSIKLPQGSTAQFVATNVSLTSMGTVRLTGLLSGGQAGMATPIVNGGGIPANNPRITIVLENTNNTFTMNPVVSSGCLAITGDGALGDTNNNLTVSATANFPGAGFTDATDLVGLRFDANNIVINPNRSITLTGAEVINVQTNNATIAASLTGVGMRKLGTGTLIVAGTGSLTGTTTVGAGTLLVNGALSTGSILVNSGATLGGTGFIDSTGSVLVNSGGMFSPGASIGTLYFGTNTLSLAGGSTTLIELNAASGACDSVTNIGIMGYGGTLIVTNLAGAFVAGQQFQLFSATNYSGNFAATNLPALGGGLAWKWTATNGLLQVVSSASSIADLSSLTLSNAPLTFSPAFVSNITSYAAMEAFSNNPVYVVPTAADAGATIQLVYPAGTTNTVASGSPSGPLTLDPNPLVTNTLTVHVTASDAVTTKDYVVALTRQPSTTPPTLSRSLSGGSLTLSWPLDHNGWTLQTQTNSRSVGLTAAWSAVPGSSATNTMTFTVSPADPTVFFRLVYP
jgi:autotransporter-associated beta strand protein